MALPPAVASRSRPVPRRHQSERYEECRMSAAAGGSLVIIVGILVPRGFRGVAWLDWWWFESSSPSQFIDCIGLHRTASSYIALGFPLSRPLHHAARGCTG